MEPWVPLFDIFLNSPCPETEASRWLQQSFNASSTPTITSNSFLLLLSKPIDAVIVHDSASPSPSSPPQTKRIMWMQTLPNAVQSRILSFLSLEHRRFCTPDLTKLARNILSEAGGVDFWVKKAARQLLDKVSHSNYEWVSCLNLDSEEDGVENEFESLPDWLKDEAIASELLLPWLPIRRDELHSEVARASDGYQEDSLIEVEEHERENVHEAMGDLNTIKDPIDHGIEEMAVCLRDRVLALEFTSQVVGLAKEIRQLCLEKGRDSLSLLGLIEPWKADDEIGSILLSNLSDGRGEELGWLGHILCSIVLPKLLILEEPASRVLVTTTIEYCKVHQTAAVYALLFPLILRKGGVNKAICDVITRIIKECLHPAHVSSFCQKLLCGEEYGKNFICLPCHQSLISHELVWTDSLFNLFQNMLNHNVHLTQDSIDHLVIQLQQSADRFSRSLKFGNFLLCFVNRCAPLLKSHKLLLTEAVGRTDTLVTKSILSKLAAL
ncbi:uncharacterized protein LOC127794072 [Diospyros lotus]|uniref:uncharacterized protein LOC127794072 n=1 Tax=Diospyros lotus TaxID=55363 RepID=UPI0022562211|nr:uncharacterized protein LOC127794072 [Diospyros lotus]